MRKHYLLSLIAAICCLLSAGKASACYANFTHTNACVGDTVWVYAADLYAVQYWNFGDSTPGTPNVVYSDTAYHIYTSPGTYYITHFVNIGAEWAYETQAVTVTTNCFNAAFNPLCNGSGYFNFINQSVGQNLTYSWDFGDPTAPDNLSTDSDPYHFYATYGNYTVTLIISDGINADTVTHIVTADTNCMSATYSYLQNTCMGDPTVFNVSFTGTTAVAWNFGDPASGTDNYSTDLYPSHTYPGVGFYVGYVAYTNGIETDTLTVTTLVTDCRVWPGDCNRDGHVDEQDVLAIGLNYNSGGTSRTNASPSFTPQLSDNWGGITMYLQDVMDKKFADCNGDGTVNNNDIAAITQNFGLTHTPFGNTISEMQRVPATAPMFMVQMPAQLNQGVTNSTEILLGTSAIPSDFVYGYAISIPYDPAFADPASINIDFGNSWLGADGADNVLNWYYNDVANHIVHIVAVRKNQVGIAGYGHIAYLNYTVPATASGTTTMAIQPTAKLMTNAVTQGGQTGNVQHFVKARLGSSSAATLALSAATKQNGLSVLPIPAANTLHIAMQNTDKIKAVSIANMVGQEVMSLQGGITSLDVSALPNGIYLLKVNTESHTYLQKVEVRH